MEVQPIQPMYNNSHAYPPDSHHSHTNGVHSDSRQYHSTSTNGHLEEGDMNPYQPNPYGLGHHGQPQQRQQYQPNQLPPMYAGGGAPIPMAPPPAPGMMGQSGLPQSPLYHPNARQQIASPSQSSQDGMPKSLAGNNGKYKFELEVTQQPQRARMCGFGDKDRRPITPPPCVRLIITELSTGKLISPDEINGTFFVLQVDLWDDTATREVNIVRSSSAHPAVSISTASLTSFPPTVERENEYTPMYHGQRNEPQPAYGQSMYSQPPGYNNPMAMGRQSIPGPVYPGFSSGVPGYYAPTHYVQNMPGGGYAAPSPYGPPPPPPQRTADHTMFTRNLIGSLTVNASSLTDDKDVLGWWFVLQDLSVRTEGMFR